MKLRRAGASIRSSGSCLFVGDKKKSFQQKQLPFDFYNGSPVDPYIRKVNCNWWKWNTPVHIRTKISVNIILVHFLHFFSYHVHLMQIMRVKSTCSACFPISLLSLFLVINGLRDRSVGQDWMQIDPRPLLSLLLVLKIKGSIYSSSSSSSSSFSRDTR